MVVAPPVTRTPRASRPLACAGVIGVAALNALQVQLPNSVAASSPPPAVHLRMVGNWGLGAGDDGLLTIGNDGQRGVGNSIYVCQAGTSFAAPVVACVVGLMLSVNPSLTAAHPSTVCSAVRGRTVSPTCTDTRFTL